MDGIQIAIAALQFFTLLVIVWYASETRKLRTDAARHHRRATAPFPYPTISAGPSGEHGYRVMIDPRIGPPGHHILPVVYDGHGGFYRLQRQYGLIHERTEMNLDVRISGFDEVVEVIVEEYEASRRLVRRHLQPDNETYVGLVCLDTENWPYLIKAEGARAPVRYALFEE